MKRILVSAILVLAVLSTAAGAGQQLRYKFEKGKTYRYQIHTENKTNGSMGGMEFTAGSVTDLTVAFVPQGPAGEGTMELIARLDAGRTAVNIPVMGIRDSTIVLTDIVGKRVKVVLSDRGKVISVTALDSLPRNQMLMMSGVAPLDLFRRLLLTLPENSVEMNGGWRENRPDTTKTSGMTIVNKLDVEYRIGGKQTGAGYDCWKIDFTGKSTMEGGGTARGMDVTIDGTMKTAGKVLFAPEQGVMVEYEATADIDQTQTFTGAQTGAQNMIITSKNSSKLIP